MYSVTISYANLLHGHCGNLSDKYIRFKQLKKE